MRKFVLLAVAAAVLSVATPSLAQVNAIPAVIPSASERVNVPALAPAVTDPETRAQMSAEIARAETAVTGLSPAPDLRYRPGPYPGVFS